MYYQGTKSVIHMSLLNEVKDDLQLVWKDIRGSNIYLSIVGSAHKNVVV